jgi:hypothetical protein
MRTSQAQFATTAQSIGKLARRTKALGSIILRDDYAIARIRPQPLLCYLDPPTTHYTLDGIPPLHPTKTA